ncbi:MAG: glycosyltransferase family 39 protein [Burkholderiaceae bacterium]|nr:glycosyltransferase family 39 protein [Burkholderiaceae bacterium]
MAIAVRLLTLPLIPLTDHTEARYAEIARLMAQFGDWISPHITPQEVFWAKPPLSTWSQALLMRWLGVNEWSGRLAAWLWSLMALGCFHWMLRGSVSQAHRLAMLAALMLCPMFFICAGAVMTDATLSACVLLVQAAWWRVLAAGSADRRRQRRAGRILALGLGLALLTKGPAAAVLALLPVLMHAAWRRHWAAVKLVLRDPVAWIIWMAVGLPWYVAAELKTPGFIQYFVLGEHVMRFIQPGWKGDRYGFAHAEPLGMIWAFTLVSALPWVLMAAVRWPWLRWKQGRGAAAAVLRQAVGSELASYALCITLAPLLLFSAAGNIIMTYSMTALPGMVILAFGLWPARSLQGYRVAAGAGAVLALMAWLFVAKVPAVSERSSDKVLIQAYERACGPRACGLRYEDKPPYSAFFYTQGRLYDGIRAEAGAPTFVVRSKAKIPNAERDTLACNKDACLLPSSELASPAASPLPSTTLKPN